MCDNTGTCRAAGYASDKDAAAPVSLLLTRAAGDDAAVKADIQVATEDDNENRPLTLWLNGKNHGTVALTDGEGTLSTAQIQAVVAALDEESDLVLQADNGQRLTVSARGAAVVLLQMDHFQRRLGTPSALVRPGTSRRAVLAPQAKPRLQQAPVSAEPARHVAPSGREYRRLLALLLAFPNRGEQADAHGCFRHEQDGMHVYPIDHKHVLVGLPCSQGAYQGADLYFLLNRNLSRVLQQVGDQHGNLGEGYHEGQIGSSFKGRGLGDCWYTSSWVWTGQRFELATETQTGLCRGFTGGAWALPRYVSDVLPAPSAAP